MIYKIIDSGGKLKKLLGKAMSSRKSLKNKDSSSGGGVTSSDPAVSSNSSTSRAGGGSGGIIDSADTDSIDDTFTFRVRCNYLHYCLHYSIICR